MSKKSLNRFVTSLLLFWSLASTAKIHSQIEEVLQKFEASNLEVQLSLLNLQYKDEAVTAAKSYLYPTLGLSGVYTKGSPYSSQLSSTNLSGYGDGGNQNISQSGSVSQANEGWNTSLSTNYYLFTGFIITDGIEKAERDKLGAQIKHKSELNSKKSNYLQALLEWQWLSETKKLIENAESAFLAIQSHKKNAQFMYSQDDELDFNEKKSYLEYQKIKVIEGLKLVEDYLIATLPEVSLSHIRQLPKITIQYSAPDENRVEQLYQQNSLSQKTLQLDVENAEGIKKVMDWQKPYIPSVFFTGGLSRSGTPEESSDETNWSAQIMMSFNFFDGFMTSAKKQQARIGVEIAKTTQKLESEKKVLFLKHQIMKSKVSYAEFNHKNAIVKQKENRLSDVKKKYNQGIATNLEMSLATIDLTKSKGEAYEAFKNYQEANLTVATELNDWERVDINAL